jgi:hypothetical protein
MMDYVTLFILEFHSKIKLPFGGSLIAQRLIHQMMASESGRHYFTINDGKPVIYQYKAALNQATSELYVETARLGRLCCMTCINRATSWPLLFMRAGNAITKSCAVGVGWDLVENERRRPRGSLAADETTRFCLLAL